LFKGAIQAILYHIIRKAQGIAGGFKKVLLLKVFRGDFIKNLTLFYSFLNKILSFLYFYFIKNLSRPDKVL